MSFEAFGLDQQIMAGVNDAGFRQATPIQREAIPLLLNGRDIIGTAQTGTGKTAAFALPILQRLRKQPSRQVRALILEPTRELAEQVHEAIKSLGTHTKARSVSVYGGVSKGPQLQGLRRGAEIVVACPGRLLDHMQAGAVDLSNVEVVVLDEADRMCDMGFLPDIRRILQKVPTNRQTLFFSATMPPEIRSLANTILKAPVKVQVDRIAPAETVEHALYPVPETHKSGLLTAMLEELVIERALVFTRTKHRAQRLGTLLQRKGHRAAVLQGNMSQPQRQAAMRGFREGRHKVLVATDIAARGLDVLEISHVINYDIPDTVDAYTHRIGRTGRVGQKGEAFTLATTWKDGSLIRQIERVLGTPIERRRLPGFDYGEFAPERQYTHAGKARGSSYLHRGRSSRKRSGSARR
ncbi:MAG: DEAD/DEAH box helicase [Candidatus Bipolaricaulota bacterium]